MTEQRLVLDTNVLVSRLLFPQGTAARAVDRAMEIGVLLASTETLAELVTVLSRPKFDRYVSIKDRKQFLQLLGGLVRTIPITHRTSVCRDPKDDKFLHVALNGEAQTIISGDRDLLALHPFHGVAIVNPASFLAG